MRLLSYLRMRFWMLWYFFLRLFTFNTTKKFIKVYLQWKFKPIRTFAIERELKRKLRDLVYWVLNVGLTGSLIYVALRWNNPIGYGVAAYLATYYIKWLVALVRLNASNSTNNNEQTRGLS